MEPERVQALRDTKALYDEGILDESEYRAKKAELLGAQAQPQKPSLARFSDQSFVAPKPDANAKADTASDVSSFVELDVPTLDDDAPRFQQRKGLGAKRGWDVRVTRDPEDVAEIADLVNEAYARRAVADGSRRRREADISLTNRGDAAAATWIFRGRRVAAAMT